MLLSGKKKESNSIFYILSIFSYTGEQFDCPPQNLQIMFSSIWKNR